MSKASKLALGALASASSASAGIVVFDFPDVTYDNLDNFGTIQCVSIDLVSQTFVFNDSGDTPAFGALTNYERGFGFYGWDVSAALAGPNYLEVFLPGSTVSSALNFSTAISYRYGSGLPRSTFFLGLRLTADGQDHFGWLELTSADFADGYTQVTFKRFAFNDVAGESITTPGTPVPEASTLGFVGGLFGLAVAAHLRRRRLKQSAASDAFLALAAGEKLN